MNKRSVVLMLFIIPLMLMAGTVSARQRHAPKDESLRRGETRATLDPNLFRDPQVRAAYGIAKEIPWVLDSMYCFCYCESSAGHISLLSCYVDTHAAM